MNSFKKLSNVLPATGKFMPYVENRYYSLYGKRYIKPVYRKEDQQALTESKELSALKHIPVKGAKHEETCSVFHDIVVEKFINYMMMCGRKAAARKTLERTFETIKIMQLEKFNKAETEEEKAKIIIDPLIIFKVAIANCRPVLKLNEMMRGGSLYQVPAPISDKESTFKAMRALVLAAREKDHSVSYWDRLAMDLIDASNNKGRVVKKKIDLHKQCEANRAYAHYRWM